MSKTAKARLVVIFIILALDITILPWLFRFPFFIKEYGIGPAAGHWMKSSPLPAIEMLFKDPPTRTLWLWLQLLVFGCLLWICWNPLKVKSSTTPYNDTFGPPAAGNGQFGDARFQTEKEVDKSSTVLTISGDNKNTWVITENFKKLTSLSRGGIVLGTKTSDKGCKLWIDVEDLHVLVIGTTRSGKSRRIYLPTIWELARFGESMIITDPKDELHKKTCDYLESQGYDVIRLDFRHPHFGNQWNPMEPVICAIEKGDYSAASEAAWDISHTIIHNKPHTGDPLWVNAPESVLAALILNTAIEAPTREEKNMTSVYRTLAVMGAPDEEGNIPINQYFESLPVDHIARDAFGAAAVAPYKTRASFFTTVLSELRLWSDPNIGAMTAGQDHELYSVGKRKTAVFLVIPDEKSTRHVLATLYIDQTYQALVNLANSNNQRLPVRVNFLLDEFGNLPAIPSFPTKLTVAGGRGMRFLLAVQALSQLKEHYKEQVETIKGNCHTWIYLLTGDTETQNEISKRLGNYTVQTDSSSATVTERNVSSGHSQGLSGRPLIYPSQLGEFPPDVGLIVRLRNRPAVLPLPDLSELPFANELNGGDKLPIREIEKVPVYIPKLPEPEKKPDKPDKPKGKGKKADKKTDDVYTGELVEAVEGKNYVDEFE